MDKVGGGWTSVASSASWPQPVSSKKETEIGSSPVTLSSQWSTSWPTPVPPAEVEVDTKQQKKEVKPPIEEELSKQSLYKTELCRSFTETGSCRYGHKCQFAHGEHELRAILRHPKYKTEFCKRFAATGLCPYGSRCRFIHTGMQTAWSSSWGTSKANQDDDEDEDEEDEEGNEEQEGPARRLAIFQNLTELTSV